MAKNSLQQFKLSNGENMLTRPKQKNIKGGAINLFCELYFSRQARKGETVDPNVLSELSEWDQQLNDTLDYIFN